MQIPYVRGRVATQAHVGVPDGTYEAEYARGGFGGRYAHLYHQHPPVGWSRIEGPLRPRAYLGTAVRGPQVLGDYLAGRVSLLANADVDIGMARLDAPMPYYVRNADGDDLLFVHAGAGRLETDFGGLPYEPGDYLLLPRGTTYRLHPTSPSMLLVIAVASEVEVPERGLLGQHALFDPAVVKVPTPGERSSLEADARGEWEVKIVRQGEVTRVFYPHCPLDVVGWKGTLAPMQLNVRDIRPVSSDRYHLPPSAHATFVAHNVVICSFLPRPLENGDPAAMKVPFYHANIDFDEVLFYHAGEFFSRQGIAPGMLTYHPQGIHHGPQAGAVTRAAAAKRTEEVAIMIDTRQPLRPTSHAAAIEAEHYWQSWQGGQR